MRKLVLVVATAFSLVSLAGVAQAQCSHGKKGVQTTDIFAPASPIEGTTVTAPEGTGKTPG